MKTRQQVQRIIDKLRGQTVMFCDHPKIVAFCNSQIVILRWVLNDIEFKEIDKLFTMPANTVPPDPEYLNMKKKRCKAINRNGVPRGSQCKRVSVENGYCRIHSPALKQMLIKAGIERKKIISDTKNKLSPFPASGGHWLDSTDKV